MTRQWKICAALLSLIAFAIAAQLAPAQKTAPPGDEPARLSVRLWTDQR